MVFGEGFFISLVGSCFRGCFPFGRFLFKRLVCLVLVISLKYNESDGVAHCLFGCLINSRFFPVGVFVVLSLDPDGIGFSGNRTFITMWSSSLSLFGVFTGVLCTLVFGVLVNSLRVSPFELEPELFNSTSIPPDFSEG